MDNLINNPINNPINKPISISDIKNLVLSGGGLLGLSYIGLFRILEERNIIKQIKCIAGCSAGAIFGSLLSIGYTSNELNTLIKTMNFKEYINITADSLLNFMKVKGLESGTNVMSFIKKCIQDKTGNEAITFQEIYEKYDIVLKIGVSNLTKSQFQILDYKTSPNLPIHKAINASIAIPLVFEPVVIDGEVYCDGGLIDNLPIECILEQSCSSDLHNLDITSQDITNPDIEKEKDKEKDKNIHTLGIYLTNDTQCLTADNYLTINIHQYLNQILHVVFNAPIKRKKATEDTKGYKIIIIEIPCDIMTFLKLNASRDDIENIINIAYETIHKNLIN